MGDRIVEVNGASLRNMSHDDVVVALSKGREVIIVVENVRFFAFHTISSFQRFFLYLAISSFCEDCDSTLATILLTSGARRGGGRQAPRASALAEEALRQHQGSLWQQKGFVRQQ